MNKKSILIILLVIFSILLAACNGAATDAPDSPPEPDVEQPDEPDVDEPDVDENRVKDILNFGISILGH